MSVVPQHPHRETKERERSERMESSDGIRKCAFPLAVAPGLERAGPNVTEDVACEWELKMQA